MRSHGSAGRDLFDRVRQLVDLDVDGADALLLGHDGSVGSQVVGAGETELAAGRFTNCASETCDHVCVHVRWYCHTELVEVLGVSPREASGSRSPLYSSAANQFPRIRRNWFAACGVPLRSLTRNSGCDPFGVVAELGPFSAKSCDPFGVRPHQAAMVCAFDPERVAAFGIWYTTQVFDPDGVAAGVGFI